MANPIIQYFKDTRSELNHVAWPTQQQTIVYTILVAAISLGVAAYLGAFDYIFTTALGDLVAAQGSSSGLQVTQQPVTSTSSTQAPDVTGPSFNVVPNTTPPSGSTQ
jgi:preprotein translocase SecE subunit